MSIFSWTPVATALGPPKASAAAKFAAVARKKSWGPELGSRAGRSNPGFGRLQGPNQPFLTRGGCFEPPSTRKGRSQFELIFPGTQNEPSFGAHFWLILFWTADGHFFSILYCKMEKKWLQDPLRPWANRPTAIFRHFTL